MFSLFFPTANKQVDTDDLEAIATEIIVKGQPIYLIDETQCALAEALSDYEKSLVVGIALNSGGVGDKIRYADDAVVKLTDWTAIIGATSLTVPSEYYLSAQKGKLIRRSDIPDTTGFKMVRIGYSTKEGLIVEIGEPFEL